MINWKRWATLGFVTGCFLRTLPVFTLVMFVVYYFGSWCVRWLRNLPKYEETCTSDMYATKGVEYMIVIVYIILFFTVMHFTKKPRVDKH